MKVTKKKHMKRSSPVSGTVPDRSMVQNSVCIAPTLFYAMRHVNDGGYLPKDKAPKGEKLQKIWSDNVELDWTKSPSSDMSAGSNKLLAIRPLHNIKYR